MLRVSKNYLEDCKGRHQTFLASALSFIKLENFPAASPEKLSSGGYFFQREQSFPDTIFSDFYSVGESSESKEQIQFFMDKLLSPWSILDD